MSPFRKFKVGDHVEVIWFSCSREERKYLDDNYYPPLEPDAIFIAKIIRFGRFGTAIVQRLLGAPAKPRGGTYRVADARLMKLLRRPRQG